MAEMTAAAAHEGFDALLDRVARDNERVLLWRDDKPMAAIVSPEDYATLERIKTAGQEWFWTEQWQRMERESDESYAASRYKTFDDVESFLADLDASVQEHEQR